MRNKRVALDHFNIKKSFAPMKEMGFFVESDTTPFKYKSETFSIINAWWMAEFSRLAYVTDKKYVRKTLKDAGFSKVKFFDGESTQLFVASNTKTMVVAFRGTEITEFSDVLVDATFWWSAAETKGVVHAGFKHGLKEVWGDLKAYIKPLMKTRTLWYTGHSLGAALATLSASRVPGTGVYTFGSPRVGSRSFVKAIKTPVYRIAKSRDIVTRIPPPVGYRHKGEMYFVDGNGKVKKNPSVLTRLYHRLGGTELKILLLLIKMIIFKSAFDLILSYLHGHSPYNYSVYMWNNIDRLNS